MRALSRQGGGPGVFRVRRGGPPQSSRTARCRAYAALLRATQGAALRVSPRHGGGGAGTSRLTRAAARAQGVEFFKTLRTILKEGK